MKSYTPSFSEYEESIKETYREKFQTFQNLLSEYNKKFNLTSIVEERDVFYKHFLDSVAGEKFIPFESSVCEVGSGAGFPSIPLKIIREDLKFTLIESTGKKCEFLKLVVKELNLSEVTVLNERAEVAARDENYREKFDVCTARAVAALNTLSEYCIPFVKVGGIQLSYKGEAEEEIAAAKRAILLLGGGAVKSYRYVLPENYGERTLVVVKKEKPTPRAYPRGNGKERKYPIV